MINSPYFEIFARFCPGLLKKNYKKNDKSAVLVCEKAGFTCYGSISSYPIAFPFFMAGIPCSIQSGAGAPFR